MGHPLFRTFAISNKFQLPLRVRDSGCQLYLKAFFADTTENINVRNRPKQLTKAEFIPRCRSECINNRVESETGLLLCFGHQSSRTNIQRDALLNLLKSIKFRLNCFGLFLTFPLWGSSDEKSFGVICPKLFLLFCRGISERKANLEKTYSKKKPTTVEPSSKEAEQYSIRHPPLFDKLSQLTNVSITISQRPYLELALPCGKIVASLSLLASIHSSRISFLENNAAQDN